MSSHLSRSKYLLLDGSECETNPLSSCPVHISTAAPDQPSAASVQAPIKFGWMYGKPKNPFTPGDPEMIAKLTDLAEKIAKQVLNEGKDRETANIPAGYTYLGQFIAHEVTFHDTITLAPVDVSLRNSRTPQIDLDSLYGAGPDNRPGLYKDYARLKVGETIGTRDFNIPFPNDLPRDNKRSKKSRNALIIDPRNDENLAIAQTHLAFIKFHNKVVDILESEGCPLTSVFKCARAQVIRHFQWLILDDYLPRIVDKDVLNEVLEKGPSWIEEGKESFMPLEFSVAAFRFGHSMVRPSYEWNRYHATADFSAGPATLAQLFGLTNFSGDLKGVLINDWVIDWRRFYDFSGFPHVPMPPTRNHARKINTRFDLKIDDLSNFPHHDMPRSVITRNLLRGLSIGLPSGEEVADHVKEPRLTHEELTGSENVLSDPVFKDRTPLWYYILKEAEIQKQGEQLGRVGSRIVAETLVGLIKVSPESVIRSPGERRFGVLKAASGEPRVTMPALLDFAKTIDPIGEHFGKRDGYGKSH